jgi:hypothetical protein
MKTWRERIVEARARGRFTDEDKDDGCSWLTCAVGEQHTRMPALRLLVPCPESMVSGYAPSDNELSSLGDGKTGFNDAVYLDDFDRAERLLDAIEDRALELKRAHVTDAA